MSKLPTNPAHGRPSEPDTDNSVNKTTEDSASHEEVYVRKRKRRDLKKKKRIRIALIVLGVIVLVAAIAAGAIAFAINSGNAALHQDSSNVEVAEEADSSDAGKTVYYNGHTYQLNENIVSLCFMGYDRDADTGEGHVGQADAIMVIAIDTETGKATCIGVPRDSMVAVDKFVGGAYQGQEVMQICLSFAYGDGEGSSAQLTTDTVARTLYNMPITYYFAMNMEGVSELNDAIGGVSLTPLQTIPGTGIVKGEPTFLYGDNALKYVQWRDINVEGSALDRQDRQIQYIQSFASQALNLAKGDVGTLLDLYNTLGEYSVTNLGVNEFSYLASVLVNKGITSVDVVTLPGVMDSSDTYAKFNLDETGVYETVLDVYYNQID